MPFSCNVRGKHTRAYICPGASASSLSRAMYVENILERTYAPGLQQVHFRKNCAKPQLSHFHHNFFSSTQQKAKTQTTTHSRINNRTQHSNIAFPNNQLFSNMHSPKKQTTTTTHTCNQAILKQKHGLKTKRSKRPALAALSSSSSVLPVTSLVIATVLFQRHIPAVSGFGVKTQTFAPNPLNFRPNNPDLRQSQSTIMRPIDVVGLRALNYRSHDNLEEQQRQHEAAVGSSSSATAASAAASSDLTLPRDNSRQPQPTRSKHQQHQTHQQHHVSSFIHTWWTSAKSKRAFEQSALDRAKTDGADREQLVLDDYLESIDRRYKRLHKHERKQARAARLAAKRNINEYHLGTVSAHVPVITSAFQFLRLPQKEPTSAGEEQRKQEDAIYVLGLANLASKRLLQRHHLPIPISQQDSKHSNSIVIDIHSKTMGRAVGPEDLNSISNSKSNSVSSSPAANTGVTTTTTNTSNVLMVRMLASTALYALQLLKNTQSAYYARVASLILRAQSHAMNTAKFGAKAFSVLLATAANLVTMNSGGKYALHFIGILMAGAVSFVRPLVSKA